MQAVLPKIMIKQTSSILYLLILHHHPVPAPAVLHLLPNFHASSIFTSSSFEFAHPSVLPSNCCAILQSSTISPHPRPASLSPMILIEGNFHKAYCRGQIVLYVKLLFTVALGDRHVRMINRGHTSKLNENSH